jgi:hypothetical protein
MSLPPPREHSMHAIWRKYDKGKDKKEETAKEKQITRKNKGEMESKRINYKHYEVEERQQTVH